MAEEKGCPIYSRNHLVTRINASVDGRRQLQTRRAISPSLDKMCLVQKLHPVTRNQIEHPEDTGACRTQQQHEDDAGNTNKRIPKLMQDVFLSPHLNIMKIHGFINTDNDNKVVQFLTRDNVDECSIMSGVTHVIYEDSDCSLIEYLKKDPTVDEKTKLEWCRQLASAVAHLHDVAGVAHRRINHLAVYVFKGTDGKPFLKLGDIMFARWPNANGMTAERNIELAFAAPETLRTGRNWRVEYDLPSDIWSLGMVFFYIMEQRKPFIFGEGEDRNKLYRRLSEGGERPIFSAATSGGLKEIIQKCWATDPEQRPTAAAVVQDLTKLNGL